MIRKRGKRMRTIHKFKNHQAKFTAPSGTPNNSRHPNSSVSRVHYSIIFGSLTDPFEISKLQLSKTKLSMR